MTIDTLLHTAFPHVRADVCRDWALAPLTTEATLITIPLCWAASDEAGNKERGKINLVSALLGNAFASLKDLLDQRGLVACELPEMTATGGEDELFYVKLLLTAVPRAT